jgi:hypothetical protein
MRPDRAEALFVGAAAAAIALACRAGLRGLGALMGGLPDAAVVGGAGGVLLAIMPIAAGVLALRSHRCRGGDSLARRPRS